MTTQDWEKDFRSKSYAIQAGFVSEGDYGRLVNYINSLLSTQRDEFVKMGESLKCDERKVAKFGDFEARTYLEKQSINAAIIAYQNKIQGIRNISKKDIKI